MLLNAETMECHPRGSRSNTFGLSNLLIRLLIWTFLNWALIFLRNNVWRRRIILLQWHRKRWLFYALILAEVSCKVIYFRTLALTISKLCIFFLSQFAGWLTNGGRCLLIVTYSNSCCFIYRSFNKSSSLRVNSVEHD